MIQHHPSCTSNYPEKLTNESPRQVNREVLGDGYFVDTCVDCGAFETNLPPEDDPYWDEAKESLARMVDEDRLSGAATRRRAAARRAKREPAR